MKLLKSSIFIVCFMLCGCSSSSSSSSSRAEDLIHLTTSIEEYHLIMSSVPGLPLDFKANEDSSDNLSYNIQAKSGDLIEFSSETGKITEIGNSCIRTYENFTIYWRPNINDLDSKNEFEIIVEVIDNDTEDVLEKDDYLVIESERIFRLMKIVFTDN